METNTMTKEQALAKFLECEVTDLKEGYQEGAFEFGREEYLVLTDSEADEKAKEAILNSVWAFNKSFLDAHSEAIAEIDEKSFSTLQEGCESVNKAFIKMIDDVDHFVDDAISCDGRGHFLSGYDSEENQEGEYYIYRVN